MVTTRRNGANTTSTAKSSSSSSSTTSFGIIMSPSSHSTVPWRLEAGLLLVYPCTLILGSLFSLLDPSTRAALYDPDAQAHHAATAPSYFALKSNLLNTYFVKLHWFWVTLAFTFILLRRIANASSPSALNILQSVARYAVVTAWWVFVTQWFFGPALIDRGFRATGGACDIAMSSAMKSSSTVRRESAMMFATSRACKTAGGKWRGGHDISGHVFILVLGSAFLTREILTGLMKWVSQRTLDDREVKLPDDDEDNLGVVKAWLEKLTLWAPVAVIALSWWMLLMTAIYFHTWFEKLTGLLVAIAGLVVTFYLPRVSPPVQSVLGSPES